MVTNNATQRCYQVHDSSCSHNVYVIGNMAGVYLLCITRVAGKLVRCATGFCKSAKHTYSPESKGTRSSIVKSLLPELGLVIVNLHNDVAVVSHRDNTAARYSFWQ